MKPQLLTAVLTSNIGEIPKNNLTAYNEKGEPLLFIDAQLNYDDLKILIDNNDGIISHIIDKALHWSPADRRDYNDYKAKMDIHIQNEIIHVTQADKTNWDSKETEAGAQLKVNQAIELLNIHINDLDVHVTKREKDRWNNTYTREQVASLLQAAKTDTDWKDAVPTYEDLFTTYPNAQKGWICTVMDTNTTYIFSENVVIEGTGEIKDTWVVAFSNSIPLASDTRNGQMSKEMYIKLFNIADNANYYVHPDNIYCRHVTDAEKKIWSNKASKDLASIFSPGLMPSSDKEKINTVEKYANFYEHPDKHDPTIIEQDAEHQFITVKERALWNDKPTGKPATEEADGQMTKEMFIKLFNIEEGANNYVHPFKHSSTDISQDTLHRFVTDSQISIWDNKEDPLNSQYKADKALEFAKEYTDTKIEQILGVSTGVLDTFEELAKALGNDPDFAANVTIALSNKVDKSIYSSHVTDYNTHLSAADRVKFTSIEANSNFYVHPDNHPASIIITDANNRFINDSERTTWNAKANGNIASESIPGQMSPEMVRKLNAITTTGKVTSDWNETDEDAGSFIRNKPKALPALGGNAATVGGYSAEELVNSRKPATIVIGTSYNDNPFTEKDVDFLCDGTNDFTVIEKAFEYIREDGGTVLFREGTYRLGGDSVSTAILTIHNCFIQGNGVARIEFNSPVKNAMILNSCTIEGIFFSTNKGTPTVSIDFYHTVIRNCSIDHLILSGGALYCKIMNNSISASSLKISNSFFTDGLLDSGFNHITDNTFAISNGTAIEILSEDGGYTNSNNVISNNIIYDCYSGIKLTNTSQAHNSINNVITGNNIMRGTGKTTDYLYEQHTIRIEKGEFNLVSNNVLRGRAAVDEGKNNMVVNNVSVL